MTQLWQLVVLWGVVLGVGTGLTALVLGAIVANRWFDARRGLVLGLLTASSATGQLIFLPIAAWLIEHFGWRMAVLPGHRRRLRVAAVLFCLFMRDRPADLGLRRSAPTAPSAPPPPRRRRRRFGEPSRACARPRAARRSGCCSAPSSSAA